MNMRKKTKIEMIYELRLALVEKRSSELKCMDLDTKIEMLQTAISNFDYNAQRNAALWK